MVLIAQNNAEAPNSLYNGWSECLDVSYSMRYLISHSGSFKADEDVIQGIDYLQIKSDELR
jgi:hypothetical protein